MRPSHTECPVIAEAVNDSQIADREAKTPIWPEVPDPDFSPSQAIENIGPLDTKNRPHKGLRVRFQWHRVNDATWKLATDETVRVPASHGQWGGYNVAKAVAWAIQSAPGEWLARCRDQASGQSPLSTAKADAMAMAKGAVRDFQIRKPIEHLNGLTARLLDRENKEPPGCNRTAPNQGVCA